jgi:predicted nucleic acid-binding protein
VVTGTALVSRAEVAAALGKAVRVDALTQEEALAALQVFRND